MHACSDMFGWNQHKNYFLQGAKASQAGENGQFNLSAQFMKIALAVTPPPS